MRSYHHSGGYRGLTAFVVVGRECASLRAFVCICTACIALCSPLTKEVSCWKRLHGLA